MKINIVVKIDVVVVLVPVIVIGDDVFVSVNV